MKHISNIRNMKMIRKLIMMQPLTPFYSSNRNKLVPEEDFNISSEEFDFLPSLEELLDSLKELEKLGAFDENIDGE